MNYKVKRLLLFIFTIVGVLLIPRISYASIGDSVKVSDQISYEGVRYPADGSTIVTTVTSSNNIIGDLYDDGTILIYSNVYTGSNSVSMDVSFFKDNFDTTKIFNIVIGDGVKSIVTADVTTHFTNLDTIFISNSITSDNVSIYGSGTFNRQLKRLINLSLNANLKVKIEANASGSVLSNLKYVNKAGQLYFSSSYTNTKLFGSETVIEGEGFGRYIAPKNLLNIYGTVASGKYTPYQGAISDSSNGISKYYNLLSELVFDGYSVPDDSEYDAKTVTKLYTDSYGNLTNSDGNKLLLSNNYLSSKDEIKIS